MRGDVYVIDKGLLSECYVLDTTDWYDYKELIKEDVMKLLYTIEEDYCLPKDYVTTIEEVEINIPEKRILEYITGQCRDLYSPLIHIIGYKEVIIHSYAEIPSEEEK